MSHVIELVIECENTWRKLLEAVKKELEKHQITDINSAQAILLFKLGDQEMTVGCLELTGCYLGTNCSYTVSKLVESRYIEYRQSDDDKRVYLVSGRGEKAKKVRDLVVGLMNRQQQNSNVEPWEIEKALKTLRRIGTVFAR